MGCSFFAMLDARIPTRVDMARSYRKSGSLSSGKPLQLRSWLLYNENAGRGIFLVDNALDYIFHRGIHRFVAIDVAGSTVADVMRLSTMLPLRLASSAAHAGSGVAASGVNMASSNALSAARLVILCVFTMFLLM
jgi:hypothetical protein